MTKKDNPLRLRRLAAGLSQTELARRAGIHRSSLVFIEEGQTRHPAAETLAALSVHLQVGESVLAEELEQWLSRQEPEWDRAQQRILAMTAYEIGATFDSFAHWRRSLRLPQHRFAAIIGVARSTVLEYEAGQRVAGMPDSMMSGLLRIGLPHDVVLALAELPPNE